MFGELLENPRPAQPLEATIMEADHDDPSEHQDDKTYKANHEKVILIYFVKSQCHLIRWRRQSNASSWPKRIIVNPPDEQRGRRRLKFVQRCHR